MPVISALVVLLVLFSRGDEEPVGAATEAPTTQAVTTEAALMPGDLNGDGKITREDRDLLIGSVNGEILLSPAQWKAADLNGDGKVDMDDCAELTMLEREGE